MAALVEWDDINGPPYGAYQFTIQVDPGGGLLATRPVGPLLGGALATKVTPGK